MKELSWEEWKVLEQKGEPYALLDVREATEREAYNIGGIWIPLGEIMQRHTEIPQDVPVIVYCRKGIRSGIAIQRLEARFGWTHLFNLRGGLRVPPL